MNDMDLMQGLMNLCCIAVPAVTIITVGLLARRRPPAVQAAEEAALAAKESGEGSAPLAAVQD